MNPLAVAVAVVVVVVVGMVAYLALRNAQDFADANQILPGVSTGAPKEWAGAHSPEARLHRRLRDAMEAMRANAALDDPSLASVRVELERQALATDERLIAAAALPRGRREAPVRQVGEEVEAIEELVASLVELRGPGVGDVGRRIDDVRTRLRLVAEAHDELAALDPASPDLPPLRSRPDAERVTERASGEGQEPGVERAGPDGADEPEEHGDTDRGTQPPS